MDRREPSSWIDPKNRWQAPGGSLAGGRDLRRDESGRRPGVFAPNNNWKWHAGGAQPDVLRVCPDPLGRLRGLSAF